MIFNSSLLYELVVDTISNLKTTLFLFIVYRIFILSMYLKILVKILQNSYKSGKKGGKIKKEVEPLL